MTHLSAAQQAQMDNRDSSGQWKSKTHSDIEDTSGVLGIEQAPAEPNALYGDQAAAEESYAEARTRAGLAEAKLATEGYDSSTQAENEEASSQLRNCAEALSVTGAGRAVLARQRDADAETERRLLGIDEEAERKMDSYGSSERVEEFDRQRDRYAQLTQAEKAQLHTAQKSRDYPLIAQRGEARQQRIDELADQGIGTGAAPVPVAEAKRSMTHGAKFTTHYAGRSYSKDVTVSKVGSDYVEFTDETGGESVLGFGGNKVQRDENGNILFSNPQMGGGLPFAAYAPRD